MHEVLSFSLQKDCQNVLLSYGMNVRYVFFVTFPVGDFPAAKRSGLLPVLTAFAEQLATATQRAPQRRA